MEESSKVASICFHDLKKTYRKGESVTFTVTLKDFQPDEKDWIGLYDEECGDLSSSIAFRFAKDTSIDIVENSEDKTMKITFRDEILKLERSKKFHFRYVSSASKVLAESSTFEVEDGTMSSESFLTVQAADSFDDTLVLVNKISSGKVTRMEEDFKKLCEQLMETKKKLDEQSEYCEILQRDVKNKAAECDEERDQRMNTEKAMEELGRGVADQMHVIEEQGQRLETLERKLSRETKLNAMLKEDMEGQRSVFEESSVEYEKLKMTAIGLKTECKHAKKMLQEERELFAEASARYEDEILLFKRKVQQMSTESNLKSQEVKLEIEELETKLATEKQQCLNLRSSLKQITEEYDDYIAVSENEMQIAKEKIVSLETALRNDEKKNLKDLKDHESAIEQLEKMLDSEKKKANSFAAKHEEMQKRAVSAEENLVAFQRKLEDADRKMLEMQDLVKGSKSELEMLKNAVSAEEVCVQKCTQSDSQIGALTDKQSSIERRSEMLLQAKSFETTSSKYTKKYKDATGKPSTKSREDTKVNEKSKGGAGANYWSWEKAKEHTIHREVFNNNNESRRYNPRFYERKRQDDAWYRENQRGIGKDNYPFARPEKQGGQLRQHRNSLLRENSRLRYNMSMLSHDCAILNYTIQQVVLEAEQKLEALYAMYLNKESQCAAYESQLQGGGLYIPDNTYGNACAYGGSVINQYDQYAVQNPEYADGYQNGTTFPQTATVYPTNYTYCDGYYDVYQQQDGILGQQLAIDHTVQYVQPIYVS